MDESVFAIPSAGPTGPVIGLVPGTVLTEHLTLTLPYAAGLRERDLEADVLKVCVFSRHGKNRNVGRGFVQGFGLGRGALASSVGHDSHNVIAVGCTDADMAAAVNRLIEIQGGFVAIADGRVVAELPLPVAGLMSDKPFEEVRDGLRTLRRGVRALGLPADRAVAAARLPAAAGDPASQDHRSRAGRCRPVRADRGVGLGQALAERAGLVLQRIRLNDAPDQPHRPAPLRHRRCGLRAPARGCARGR